MGTFKYIILTIAILLLAACETPPLLPDDYDGPTARIYDKVTNRETKSAHFFELDKVNGKLIPGSISMSLEASYGQGMILTVIETSREVPAGEELTLSLLGMRKYAAPILEIMNGSFKVHGVVTFTPEQGKSYTVKGELSKEYSAIWLEDTEGNIVSDKVERQAK